MSLKDVNLFVSFPAHVAFLSLYFYFLKNYKKLKLKNLYFYVIVFIYINQIKIH